jgi:hypothetical protein
LAVFCFCIPAAALDTVRFHRDERVQSVTGRILATPQNGGLLLEMRDGILWAIEPHELLSRTASGVDFVPLPREEFSTRLLSELPTGFQAHHTAHYTICYNTSQDYAVWCGGLFERLYRAFTNFWSRRGFELHEPEFPLPVIIFADARPYAAFARDELGGAATSIVAYYSLRTNRVTMHDLTGVESVRAARGASGRDLDISGLLAQAAAEPLVATIVHEATHQIAFNCGLHTRYADVPLWLSEGLAIYFETPDLSSSTGWQGIGRVNYRRLATYRDNLGRRNNARLEQLVASDRLFRNTETGPEAYADAWALTYYLIRTRQEDYVAYLKMLSEKPRLVWDDEAMRIREFQRHFGRHLSELDMQARAYIELLR